MAEILTGQSDHCRVAPLSTGQSVAISQHLQGQLDQLHLGFEELQQQLQKLGGHTQSLRGDLGKTKTSVHSLKDGFASLMSVVDNTNKDLGRTNAAVGQLQEGLESTMGKLSIFEEQHASDHRSLQRVEKELTRTVGLAQSNQDTIEKRIFPECATLRGDLGKTNASVGCIRADLDKLRLQLSEDGDGFKSLKQAFGVLRSDLAKTVAALHHRDQRLTQIASEFKDTQQRVLDLEGLAKHTRGDLDNTKGHLSTTQGTVGKLVLQGTQLVEDVGKCQKKLSSAQARLDSTCGVVNTLGQTTQKLCNRVGILEERIEGRGIEQIHNILRELAEVSRLAKDVKTGLEDTNSLVLPNLRKELDTPSKGTKHGRMLPQEARKTPRSPSTPRALSRGSGKNSGGNPLSKTVWT